MKRSEYTGMQKVSRMAFCLAITVLCLMQGCGTGKQPGRGLDPDQAENRSGRVRLSERASTYEEIQGRRIYNRYCVHCHGFEGQGDGFNAYALQTPPRDLSDPGFPETVSDSLKAGMIRFGGRRESVSPQMPAFGFTLTPEEIGFLTAAIRAFHKKMPSTN